MARTSIKTQDPSTIPEVVEFENARVMLEVFKTQNASLISTLNDLLEHYNQTREAAEKAVRGAAVRCGDFDLYQQIAKTDGEKVLSAVGRDLFIEMGGAIKAKNEAKIGVKQLDTALGRGLITQELYDEVVRIEPRYHMPPVGTLP